MTNQIFIGIVLALIIIAANLPDCIIAWRKGERPSNIDEWGLAIGIGFLIAWILKLILH